MLTCLVCISFPTPFIYFYFFIFIVIAKRLDPGARRDKHVQINQSVIDEVGQSVQRFHKEQGVGETKEPTKRDKVFSGFTRGRVLARSRSRRNVMPPRGGSRGLGRDDSNCSRDMEWVGPLVVAWREL